MSSENKLGKFKNRYRKIYGYHRTEPDIRTYTDEAANATITVDVSKVKLHRDYFKIDKNFEVGLPIAEYEEDVFMVNGTSNFHIFTTGFSGIPTVTVDIWPDPSIGTVYISDVTAAKVTVGLSAEMSCSVRYKAVYYTKVYPAQVRRSPLYPSTITSITAGQLNLVDQYSGSLTYLEYATITSNIPELSVSTQDVTLTQADVYIQSGSVGVSNTDITLSSHFNGKINFIVLDH